MNYVLIYSSATLLGGSVGVLTAAVLYKSLTARLRARAIAEATAHDLEKRRDIALSGREDEVRENAGPAAVVTNLFPVKRLGTLASRNVDRGQK